MKVVQLVIDYFQGVRSEISKVAWPTRQTVINHTIFVIISVIIAMALVGAFDYGLSKLLELTILRE